MAVACSESVAAGSRYRSRQDPRPSPMVTAPTKPRWCRPPAGARGGPSAAWWWRRAGAEGRSRCRSQSVQGDGVDSGDPARARNWSRVTAHIGPAPNGSFVTLDCSNLFGIRWPVGAARRHPWAPSLTRAMNRRGISARRTAARCPRRNRRLPLKLGPSCYARSNGTWFAGRLVAFYK